MELALHVIDVSNQTKVKTNANKDLTMLHALVQSLHIQLLAQLVQLETHTTSANHVIQELLLIHLKEHVLRMLNQTAQETNISHHTMCAKPAQQVKSQTQFSPVATQSINLKQHHHPINMLLMVSLHTILTTPIHTIPTVSIRVRTHIALTALTHTIHYTMPMGTSSTALL